MRWDTVIGLEVHAELLTKSKIFCGCTAEFGGEPNSRVCPICSGMPGTLPKLNRAVVEHAVRVGLALECTILKQCKFDRKNYFYPDLPKAYQVSQLYSPICRDGHMDIIAGGQKKRIGIREIHMEEDAGKLIHSDGETYMDFNRCGVPLLEIVTLPDFRNVVEVHNFLDKLRETLLYLGVCDCKMQEGSLRVDVNLSIRPAGCDSPLGTRTETKNLNSLKAIGRAIEFEQRRQIELLESGGEVVQETRRWVDDIAKSFALRSKENSPDYRYFPEPDLLPIDIDEQCMAHIKKTLPELAHQKRERFTRDYALSEKEAAALTNHKKISDLFEAVSELSKEPREAAHLFTGEIMRLMKNTNTLPEVLDLDTGKLARLVSYVSKGKINRSAYKETVEAVFLHDADPELYITEHGLLMFGDAAAVTEAAKAVLSEYPEAAADYRAGKEKAFGFLMGKTMTTLGGNGNPDIVRRILKKTLDK